MLAGPLRLAALVCCLLVGVSFVYFAVDQLDKGSAESQAGVSGQTTSDVRKAQSPKKQPRRFFDGAASTLESPFDGLTDDSSSAWVRHGVPFLLALLVYGFGLSFLARFSAGRP